MSQEQAPLSDLIDTVYLGDVLDLLAQLPDQSVDMVYGDPDYNVGIKYEGKSYTRGFDEYIDWYIRLARESLRVLKDDGNLFLINYPKQNAYLRVRYLDQACYEVLDYVWIYNTNIGHSPRRFTTAHRSVLHARKTRHNRFYKDQVAVPYQNPNDRRIKQRIAQGSKGRMPYSWFYFDLVKNVSREKTRHPCQIPQGLYEMLLKASTQPGDLVLVLFGGSGSEVEVTHRLGRHFLSAEIDPEYHRLILERLGKGKVPAEFRLPLQQRSSQPEDRQPRLFESSTAHSSTDASQSE